MGDDEQGANERILEQLRQLQVKDNPLRHRAVHEAGHAIAALDKGLPLTGVGIEKGERVKEDGTTSYGAAKVRPPKDCFTAEQLGARSPEVLEHAKNRVIFLSAAEAATKLILKANKDSLADKDLLDIENTRQAFPEITAEMDALREAAKEVVSRRQADIEKLAEALLENMSLSVEAVRQLIAG